MQLSSLARNEITVLRDAGARVAGLHPGNVGSVLYDPNRAADGPTEGNRPELLAMH
jgi:hypothetical protein